MKYQDDREGLRTLPLNSVECENGKGTLAPTGLLRPVITSAFSSIALFVRASARHSIHGLVRRVERVALPGDEVARTGEIEGRIVVRPVGLYNSTFRI